MVLDDLVLDDAHAGLGNRILCQGDSGLVGRDGRSVENLVDLLLRERRKLGLRLAHAVEPRGQCVEAVDDLFRHSYLQILWDVPRDAPRLTTIADTCIKHAKNWNTY